MVFLALPGMERSRLPRWPFAVLITVLVLAGVSVVASAVVVPYYAYSPGPVYEVDNFVETDAGELNGEFLMLTILQHEASALETLLAMADPTIDLYERQVINPDDLTPEERRLRNLQSQAASQETAQLVALSYLGYEFTGDGVLVVRVLEDVPAAGTLLIGDVIVAVDGTAVSASQDVAPLIGEHDIGDQVTLTVQRDDEIIDLVVTLTSLDSEPDRPIVGFTATTFMPRAVDAPAFDIDSRNVGGPSAGLMYTLGLIDLLSEDDLLGGRNIAGTGTIRIDRSVGPIGGVRQKVVAAEAAGAEVMFIPEGNWDAAQTVEVDGMELVMVSTLQDALDYLAAG